MSQNSRVGTGVEKFRGAGLDLLLLFFVCAVISGWMYTRAWPAETRTLRAQFVEAQIVSGGGLLPRAGMLSARRAGEPHGAREVLARARVIDPKAGDAIERLLFFAVVGGGVGAAALYPMVRGWRGRGRGKDRHLTGGRITSSFRLRARLGAERAGDQLLGRWPRKKQIKLGEISLPVKLETRHILITGTTRSGKSTAIRALLRMIRERGERAIVTDIKGDLMSALFVQGDKLLSAFDLRGERWSPAAEVAGPWDADAFAESAAVAGDERDKSWTRRTQTLIAAVFSRLLERGEATNERLLYYLTRAPLDELSALVSETEASVFFGMAREFTDSVRGGCGEALRAYKYLHPQAGIDAFSIRKFVRDETRQGWLWLPYSADQSTALRPLLATWIGAVISAALSMTPDESRRLWLVTDELSSLGRVSNFIDGLARGAGFGLCSVAGIQSVSQLRLDYGLDGSDVLLGCYGTHLVLRTPDEKTAKHMSGTLGGAVVEREEESRGDKGSTVSTHRDPNYALVHWSEIQTLPDLVGYLKLVGDYPVARVKIPRTKTVERIKPFIPRQESKA